MTFTVGLSASFQLTLLSALVLPVMYYSNYHMILGVPSIQRDQGHELLIDLDDNKNDRKKPVVASDEYVNENSDIDLSNAAGKMTAAERLKFTIALWPFMIPLIVVYFAEYAMQSGVWAAIGFPITSENARNQFYSYSNWMYQGGVLVSRSSGLLWKADMKALWLMPTCQVGILIFFTLDAFYMWWYDWSLLILCFIVGLFGGGVYVGGFALVAETVDPNLKEFSLSAASLGSDIGVAFSNIAGIFIQKSIYNYHDISD